ncbi:MAG: hypothetical protein ABSA53_02455 [Streptosporangiaceae bacterium]|jgi:hypothetical protein
MATEPVTAPDRPPHKTSELTTSELARWRGELEQAVKDIPPGAPGQAGLCQALAEAAAEEEDRARIAARNA